MPHPEDDPTIPDETVLWRRVLPRWIVPDGQGGTRLSSAAFKDRTAGGMSVHIAADTDPEAVLAGHPEDSLVSFTAGQIREKGDYAIRRLPTEEHPAHVVIFPTLKKTPAKKMAQVAEWIIRRE